MLRCLLCCAAVALVAAATSARAEGVDDDLRLGSYVGLEMGGGFPLFSTNFAGSEVNAGWSGGVWYGVRYSPIFSLEGQLHLTRFDVDGDSDHTATSLMVNMKMYHPMGAVDPHILLGIGGMFANGGKRSDDFPSTDWAFQLGFGLDYYVMERLSVGLTTRFVKGLGDVSEVKHIDLVVGFQYHFASSNSPWGP